MAKTNRPSSSDVDVSVLPCVRLVNVTVAPGSIPPWASLTEPDTEALVVCAGSVAGATRQRMAIRTGAIRDLRILRTTGILLLLCIWRCEFVRNGAKSDL